MIDAGTAFVLNNPGIKVADKFRGIFLAMLSAAPPAAKELVAVEGWRTIETAPKDRTVVVLIGVTEGNGFTGGRPYRSDPWCGWFSDGEWQRWPHPWPPTHWMPLPAPPSS